MAWLAGYNYAQLITITGSASASTNYPVLLKVGESSGSVGANFNVAGHSLNFPNDIRFTASTSTTQLNYYLESVSGTTPNRVANIWVNVSASLATNQSIYCYYGNSSATSASNGVNTFTLFDDFSTYTVGSSINGLGGWGIIQSSSSSSYAKIAQVDGKNMLQIYSAASAIAISKACNYTNSIAARAYIKNISASECFAFDFFSNNANAISTGGTPQYGYALPYWGWSNTLSKIVYANNYSITYLNSVSSSATANTYYTVESDWYGSNLNQSVNGSVISSATNSNYTTAQYFGMHVYTPNTVAVSYVLIRQYVSPEPVFSSTSTELTAPPPPTNTSAPSNFFIFF